MEELLLLVDRQGRPLGVAPRSACHADPTRLHAVVHALVVTTAGAVLLQQRSPTRDVCPGLWDTSVGGHLQPGEHPLDAIRREALEELGLELQPEPLYTYVWEGRQESEFVHAFLTVTDAPVHPDPLEITAVRAWTPEAIDATLGTGVFTPNFEVEWQRYRAWAAARA